MTDYIREVAPGAVVMLWPMRAKVLPTPMESAVIYELVDDHALFPEANETWARLHALWVEKADVMVATADDLAAQLRAQRPDALLLPNGVRLEDWATPTPCPVPADLEAARRAPVVIGYYGSIAEWFDWELWEQAAAARPDWAFVLIGVSYDHKVETVTAHTQHFSNMWYLGPKPYAELPAYLAGWDAGFMPFALNESTRFISPTKTPEFLAAGLPVVSTPVLDVVRDWGEAGLVEIAKGPAAFADALGRVLARPRTEWLRAVDRRLSEISWDRTWEEMRLRVSEAGRGGGGGGAASPGARVAE